MSASVKSTLQLLVLGLAVLLAAGGYRADSYIVVDIDQDTVDNGAGGDLVPSTAVGGQSYLCIKSVTAVDIFCRVAGDGTTVTTSNGFVVFGQQEECFYTPDQLSCITAASSVEVAYKAYKPF